MSWKTVITDGGKDMISRSNDTGKILITRVVGSSSVSAIDSLSSITDISSPQYLLSINKIDQSNDKKQIIVRVTPSIIQAYTLKQIGLYARTIGDTKDVLLSVSENTIGDAIPAYSDNPDFVTDYSVILPISSQITMVDNSTNDVLDASNISLASGSYRTVMGTMGLPDGEGDGILIRYDVGSADKLNIFISDTSSSTMYTRKYISGEWSSWVSSASGGGTAESIFSTFDNAIYRFDTDTKTYVCIGRDYTEIDAITCALKGG